MSYNGWTNYETWLVVVWTDGDDTMREIANHRSESLNYACDELRDYVLDAYLHNDGQTSGLANDFIASALSDVDWREIVASLLDDDDTDHGDEE